MAAERGATRRREADPPRAAAPVRRAVPAAAPADLDRLIHDRTRLAIVSALAAQAPMSFTDLKVATETSDGNLSVHARKLEEAGYLACTKSFEGRMPRTEYQLTARGRQALQKYLDHMEAIIRHARKAR
ncbi:MAG: winged helix-turn-helix domain-containing protein [Vicinamibacterales bacterium]